MRTRIVTRIGAALVLGAFWAATSAGAQAAAPRAGRAPAPAAEGGSSTCHKLPAGKRVVKLNLKPETDITDLVAWISAITCEQYIVPGTIPAGSRKVTVVSPGLMTRAEAQRLFLDALESVGLTVYRAGSYFRVIETPKAKTSAIPVYGFDEK